MWSGAPGVKKRLLPRLSIKSRAAAASVPGEMNCGVRVGGGVPGAGPILRFGGMAGQCVRILSRKNQRFLAGAQPTALLSR